MSVSLTPPTVNLYIGGVPWPTYSEISLATSALSDDAWLKSGTLIIPNCSSNPVSIDTNLERAFWAAGQEVSLEIVIGGLPIPHPFGIMRILRRPDPPTADRPEIEIALVDLIGFYTNNTPSGDASGVVIGSPEKLSTIASRYLEKAGVPPASISLPVGDYEVGYPLNTNGITEAAKLLIADNYRVLYQDSGSLLQSRKINPKPAPAISVQIGQDEVDWFSDRDLIQPVNKIKATGLLKNIVERENPLVRMYLSYGNGNSSSGDPIVEQRDYSETFVEPGDRLDPESIALEGGAIFYLSDYLKVSEVIQRPRSEVDPEAASPARLTTVLSKTTFTQYSPGRVKQNEAFEVFKPRGLIDPAEQSNRFSLAVSQQGVTRYYYDPSLRLVRREQTQWEPKIAVNAAEAEDPFGLVQSLAIVEIWEEQQPGVWSYQAQEIVPRVAEQDSQQDPYDLVLRSGLEVPREEQNFSPPATEYLPSSLALQDQFLEAEIQLQDPSSGDPRAKERTWDIVPCIEQAQIEEIGRLLGSLAFGRSEKKLLEVPITDVLLLLDYPGWGIRVDDGPTRYDCLVDSVAYVHTGVSASVSIGCLPYAIGVASSPLDIYAEVIRIGGSAMAQAPPPTPQTQGVLNRGKLISVQVFALSRERVVTVSSKEVENG